MDYHDPRYPDRQAWDNPNTRHPPQRTPDNESIRQPPPGRPSRPREQPYSPPNGNQQNKGYAPHRELKRYSPRDSINDLNQRARAAWRRARTGVSQMYEAVSREVRTRADRRRAPRPSNVPNQVYNSLPNRAHDEFAPGYDMDMPPVQVPHPAQPRQQNKLDPASEIVPQTHRSLAMRLRKRRNKVRGTPASRTRDIIARTSIALSLVLIILVGGFLGYHTSDLNTRYGKNIAMLTQQKDNQITRIYDRHGVLLAQLANNDIGGRTYLTYCQLPTNILKATVDTEDATFWDNPLGIDILATIKALTRDTGGGAISGASTITQQVVKNVILADSSRTGLQGLQRKLDEALLSMEITQQYSKTDILTLYLNTIPYGGTVLGIESAAQSYFHLSQKTLDLSPNADHKDWTDADWAYYKHVTDSASGCKVSATQETVVEPAAWQLANWQAMLLAGIPQSPACHNPYLRPHDVLVRFHDGVLPNVAKHDASLITDSPAYADPKKVQIHDYSNNLDGMASYVYSQIRTGQGDEADQTKGIGAICSNHDDYPSNPPKVAAGYVRGIFGSSGANGQQRVLAPYFVDYVKEVLASKIGNIDQYIGQGWNIYTSLDYGNPDLTQEQLDSIYIDQNGNLASDSNKLSAEQLKTVGMQQYAEMVVNRNITGGVDGTYPDWWFCDKNSASVVIYRNSPYARDRVNPFENQPTCERKALNLTTAQGGRNVGNGALVALDPRNGDILAMVGGADYYQMNDKRAGQLNMTIEPRSMGSSFKPIVYATAFEMGWNPGIIIPDEPTCFPSPPAGSPTAADKSICPHNYLVHNYITDSWFGYIPLTELLNNSLNTPAELTLQFTGLRGEKSPFLAMAQRMGITTLKAGNLGPATALGAQEVPLLEETEAYATLANNGVHEPSRAILEVTDFTGNLVKDASGQSLYAYDPNPPGGQAISPQAAYQITSILSNNQARYGEFGASSPLHFWNRDVAAKTGTSELIKDLTTAGYTPGLAIGAWSGNDDDTPTDPSILGIAGAAYIFNAVMAFGIDRLNLPGTKPTRNQQLATTGGYFPVPSGMHRAQLSCKTGMAPFQGDDVTKECKPYDHPPTPQLMAEFGSKTTWDCSAWGCNKSDTGAIPGTDIAWVINGQDPMVP
jgi:membrane peptidoglycan carboxypeptidase